MSSESSEAMNASRQVFRLPTRNRPSKFTLDSNLESARDTLLNSLSKCQGLEEMSLPQLNNLVKEIKASCRVFETASVALSKYLSDHGMPSAAAENTNERLALVYTEVKQCVSNLNIQIVSLGGDAASDITRLSHTNVQKADALNASAPVFVPVKQKIGASSLPAIPAAPKNTNRIEPFRSCDNNNDLLVEQNDIVSHVSNLPREETEQVVARDSVSQADKLPQPCFNEQSPVEKFVASNTKGDKCVDYSILDPISRMNLRQQLLSGFGDPFAGEPDKFHAWKKQIQLRLLETDCSALDSLYILKANTKAEPRRVVESYINVGIDHVSALDKTWTELKKRFGSNILVSDTFLRKLKSFPNIRNVYHTSRMIELRDLCKQIQANMDQCSELKILELQSGMRIVWEKFPENFQNRWQRAWGTYERKYGMSPSLSVFLQFLDDYIDDMTAPAFMTQDRPPRSAVNVQSSARTLHTESQFSPKSSPRVKQSNKFCVVHGENTHSTLECYAFARYDIQKRKQLAFEHRLCYNCLNTHKRANCNFEGKCEICGRRHLKIMHDSDVQSNNTQNPQSSNSNTVTSNCIAVCGDVSHSKVSNKTVLVKLKRPNSSKEITCLCVIDEQSDVCFIDTKTAETFGALVNSSIQTYSVDTVNGVDPSVTCHIVEGFQVRGVREKTWIELPGLLTLDRLPSSKKGVSTRSIVEAHPHVRNYASNFPYVADDAEVLLIVGANCGEAMRTRVYGDRAPFAHHTALGWALVGPSCMSTGEDSASQRTVNVLKCVCDSINAKPVFEPTDASSDLCSNVFVEHSDDEMPGISRNDKKFVDIVSNSICVNESGKIQMPLPIKDDALFSSNREAVLRRTKNTLYRVKKDSEMIEKCREIMNIYTQSKHVEEIPDTEVISNNRVNYLPIFPIKQPKKSKIRLVFDAAAIYSGRSLNDTLIQGPDENNRLTGVLTRFRHGVIAFTGDIQLMFHSFDVSPEHRDLLRFFWFRGNDPNAPLVDYRATVHVFGLKSSPSIATHGLRYCTTTEDARSFPEACEFIVNNMYVDDGLGSSDNVADAVKTLHDVRNILEKYKIRFHKIASNSNAVLNSFPSSECVSPNDNVTLTKQTPLKALGLTWNVSDDNFVLKISFPKRPFTKRGIVSAVNSLYDPLGIACPITLQGRLLQRQFLSDASAREVRALDWDDPLPAEFLPIWESWVEAMSEADDLNLPRCFVPVNFATVKRRELHVFCDASQDAIGFVIYLRSVDINDAVSVSFVCAASKVAPRAASTIPRLELCAAVDATLGANRVKQELDRPLDLVRFHSDSKVVLGYINNQDRRFTKYVTSRVNIILKHSNRDQWSYVTSAENPADLTTRPQTSASLKEFEWFDGPHFLQYADDYPWFSAPHVVELPETTVAVHNLSTSSVVNDSVSVKICQRVSNLSVAKRIAQNVCNFVCSFSILSNSALNSIPPIDFLIRDSQRQCFPDEYSRLKSGSPLKSDSILLSLSPYLDSHGVIRVGGRLKLSEFPLQTKHPVLLPSKHPLTNLIVRFYHHKARHQGRHLTHGAVREAGYHVCKGQSVIRKLISDCVVCKKLRAPTEDQCMSELPAERLSPGPAFTAVGVDCFGHYLVHDGKSTRRTSASKKVWAVLFTCLSSRAVHIEPLTSLDISSFRLALRRFFSIRGQCKVMWSDNGTNLIGTRNQLSDELRPLMDTYDCRWELNPPGASHQGGVWERKIGSVKSVLDASFALLGTRTISREELYTLFQEAACTVNSTPLYAVSCDPNDPLPISPNMLLTLKDSSDYCVPGEFSNADLLRYGSSRWRRIQYLSTQFWIRWKKGYIQNLQSRKKWFYPKRNMLVGDIVLLRETSPRNQWPLAVVIEASESKDKLVRNVTVKTYCKRNDSVRVLRRCVNDLIRVCT